MKLLFRHLRLFEEYTFKGDHHDFNEALHRPDTDITDRPYHLKREVNGGFWLVAKRSRGVLISGSGNISKIKVAVEQRRKGTNLTIVTFKTSIRIELILNLLMFLAFIIGSYFDELRWYTIPFLIVLFIVCHGWFHWVYRAQEKSLMESVIDELSLEKVK